MGVGGGGRFAFSVEATAGNARAGVLTTPHGAVPTPVFMAVGTRGTVKGLLPDSLARVGVRVLLGNTYHLALRPGPETVRRLGGLHGMFPWDGPILTDSGGFQVFSLGEQCAIDDDGATFKSHIDGAILRLTPEDSMAVQRDLGADFVMCFDQCVRNPASADEAGLAVERTIRWAARCRAALGDGDQALLGIVQGATDLALRARCARAIADVGFFGHAIGGLSVGEDRADTLAVLDAMGCALPADAPRYLMGVGPPPDLLDAIARGVDMFDCVLPTRNGRTGQAFTWDGTINLKNQKFKDDPRPIDPSCDDPVLSRVSRGAIRHYLNVGEMAGAIVVSLHNLWFFQRLMRDARAAIVRGTFEEFSASFLRRYRSDGSNGG